MAAGSVPRKIVIDDTSSRIDYSPNWRLNSSGGELVDTGPTFLNTLHETQGSSGFSFAFPFNGTAVEVVGVTERPPPRTTITDISCFVDGAFADTAELLLPADNWIFCAPSGLEDTEHVLTVEISVASGGSSFKLDYILYVPSANTPINAATVMVDNTDPSFQYDDSWLFMDEPDGVGTDPRVPGKRTSTPGSKVTFDFIGQSLTWYGMFSDQFPSDAASATFVIDGGPPTTFGLNGSKGNSANQVFFTTPILDVKQHTLEVTYNGNGAQTPLSLAYVIVTNSTTAPLSPSSLFVPLSSPSSLGQLFTSTLRSPKDTPISLIVGATVGWVAALGLVVFFALLWRRRGRNRSINPQTLYPFSPGASLAIYATTETVGGVASLSVKPTAHAPGAPPRPLTLVVRD